jgi:sirohydrochlorin ferrochelatase
LISLISSGFELSTERWEEKPMKSVLIVAHGSRATETEQMFEQVVSQVRDLLPDQMITSTFMQLSENTLDKMLVQLAQSGVTEIRIVPYFLFNGIHIQEDIPETMADFTRRYPDIKLSLAPTLGSDSRLADILVDRISH